MLLLCDIGNTALKFGVAENNQLIATFSLPNDPMLTNDELGLQLLSFLARFGIEKEEIAAIIAASVAPRLNPVLCGAIKSYLKRPYYFAPEDLPIPLENQYADPRCLGADRLICAYAARRIFPKPVSIIIADYGTALTFDCVEGNAFIGGLIFPGPKTAAASLAANTAKLPLLNFSEWPGKFGPQTNTENCMKSGLAYGFAAITEAFCQNLRSQLKAPTIIIATGGYASLIANLVSIFDKILPDLSLEGLARLYNSRKAPSAC